MSNALKKAKLNPAKIDYINVHGTGTDNNDLTEGKAMLRLFGDAFPPFSSTKAYTGHTLGAAGAVESIISILSLTNDKIFPNIGFSQPIDETGLIPVTSVKEKNLQHVLTNSFGFGGNDSSLVFSKWNENQEPGSRSQDSELKTQDSKLKTQDSGLETQDSGLETQDSRLKTPIYINGLGAVTPQDTLNESYLEEVTSYQENFLQIKKPNYRDFINPKVLRRMSKIVRMGIVSSKIAMEDAGIKQPDAIITGTGMGCQADTEKFLNSMLDNNEQLLNPTAFIQSTHNTTGAQIALMLGNNYYNFAYVHRTFSFESALLDSMMLIRNNEAENILLGGIDEITEESWLIKTRIGYYKKNTSNNLEILSDDQEGALAGESAAFFMLSDQRTDNSYAQVTGVDTFFKPDGPTIIEKRINAFLTQHEMEPEDVDLVLMGYNGDLEFDTVYKEVEEKTFNKQDIGYFKHLCGEHDTASSFAMWIAARILKTGSVPEIILNKNINTEKPKTVLIYNHFRNINHSLILLKKA